MGNAFSQSFFIPAPELTEKTLPNQSGKVFIVTGGYAGCGEELARMLYGADGIVYIAGRNKPKADRAIASLKSTCPNSSGRLEFMPLDLSDLATIKPAVEAFTSRENRLDVLTNNAGVMMPPPYSKDTQGYELQMGTNCLGPFLLTKLLTPLLAKTAASSAPGSVRVTWAGSLAVDMLSPKPGGMDLASTGAPKILNSKEANYGQSTCGNLFLASEAARRYGRDGIISVCWNPGNLKTELKRHMNRILAMILNLGLHEPKFGAYTELNAGLGKQITPSNNGCYVIPWGRIGSFRSDIALSLRSVGEGGNGKAETFWEWCARETAKYA